MQRKLTYRTFAGLLTVFYFALSIGVGYKVHYCHGKAKSIEFVFTDAECCCSFVPSLGQDDCCDDEVFFYQMKEDQQFSTATPVPSPAVIQLATTQLISNPAITAQTEINPEIYDLPPPERQPLYILNSSLTYYG